VRTEIISLDPASYQPHLLHAPGRVWAETNCYVDLWIEILHAFGFNPAAAGAFALSSDFEGDQWTFFKYPPEDLRALYGIEVRELTVWRPLTEHIEEYLLQAALLTVEVDACYLPDTAGISYGTEHVKTTIAAQMIDRDEHLLGYFHNSAYYQLSGADYTAIFGSAAGALPPYVELVRLGPGARRHATTGELVDAARGLARIHVARRPSSNPVERFACRLERDLSWLTGAGLSAFHSYAFATCRQCGAAAEIGASFIEWLITADPMPPEQCAAARQAVAALTELATAAKALEFTLARAAAGRRSGVSGLLDQMAACWQLASAALGQCYGS
jgi:hypothetical protein